MAELTSMVMPTPADQVFGVGTGGTAREKAAYVDGKRQDVAATWLDGSAVHRLTGIAISVAGQGLDGAVVETTTPLENVAAGTVFRAEGHVEIRVRADGRPGFNGGGPRGVLTVTVFIQRLVPVGAIDELLVAMGDAAAKAKR
ncbi:hypothetical protein [Tsukamurella sp. USMM236]|uniref:hypothetical protein n=1 Tax=Tsukamurella sp. USMM236 TaxID=3081301 RepID=UPI00301ADCFC